MFESLLRSLNTLLAANVVQQVEFATSDEELHTLLQSTSLNSFDLIFLEQYGQSNLERIGDINDVRACQLRFIDFWGTPPEQNHQQLNPHQFLVPYPNAWNEHIGFIVDSTVSLSSSSLIDDQCRVVHRKHDRLIGFIHGKLGVYMVHHLPLLQALLERFDIIVTIHSDNLNDVILPSGITNVGQLASQQYRACLRSIDFVLGLGHPILAPTGLLAIAQGTPYIFANYHQPFVLNDLPRHPVTSQHDFLLSFVGAPMAYAVALNDPDEVIACILQACGAKFEPTVIKGFSVNEHLNALTHILHTSFC